MPQISQIGAIYASQLFWLAIVFAAIYFGIGKAMVPRIEATIDDRNGRISGDLAAAEAARAAAFSSEQGYRAGLETARSSAAVAIADAKARATAGTGAKLRESDAAMTRRIAEATDRIDLSRRQALGEIEAATADAVGQIVAKLSGVTVDRATVENRVRTELAHG